MNKNAQEVFLTYLYRHQEPVTVFLQCGVKLQGVITGLDADGILLRREAHTQFIYKHAVSTIMPVAGIHDFGDENAS